MAGGILALDLSLGCIGNEVFFFLSFSTEVSL